METRICTKCGEEKPATTEYFYRKGEERLRSMCKVCRQQQSRQYYQDNKEQRKQYHDKNKDAISERDKQYREKNKAVISERDKQYYQDNKEYIGKTVKEWGQQNPEKVRGYSQKREAIKRGLPHTLTVQQWENIKKVFNNRCAYCGDSGELEQEHFVPLSKGGGYTEDNIVPSCKPCNSSKNAKSFEEWYPCQGFYSKKQHDKILVYIINGQANPKSGVL